MNTIQKLIIAFMGTCVLVVFVAIFIVGAQTWRQIRAVQIAAQPTPTSLPTNVYPATYTPTPLAATLTPITPPVIPTLVLQSDLSGSNSTAIPQTPRPRVTVNPNNPAAVAIEASLRKLQDVKTMRFEIDLSMEGDFGADIPPDLVQDDRATLLGVMGALKNQDSHLVLKGLLSAMFGADPGKGIEFMSVGGKTYIRGPMPMFGVADDKWYVAEGSGSFSAGVVEPDQVMSGLEDSLNLPGITKSGVEPLDGMSCDVYRADREATIAALQDLDQAQSQLPTTMDLAALEVAETKIWICADGYFHQLQMTVKGKSKDAPTQTVGMQVLVHMYDLNGNVTITPPPDAKPLEFNLSGFFTPTPVAQ
ncbi:MAG: hypothetical protein HY741_02195 [Chloroflexi bacterium]|nr:hypothetical protein [Chloroflexota bacterium]